MFFQRASELSWDSSSDAESYLDAALFLRALEGLSDRRVGLKIFIIIIIIIF